MSDTLEKQINDWAESFAASSKLLNAMGNETRQYLILKMIKMGDCNGVRVGAIAAETNLSRPAVSHHLKIMKEAGLIKVRREGTKNYYFFDPEMKSLERLIETLQLAAEITKTLPHRCGEDNEI